MKRDELLDILRRMMEEDLKSLAFQLNMPSGLWPGSGSSPGKWALQLLEWVESPTGCGLEKLESKVEAFLTRADNGTELYPSFAAPDVPVDYQEREELDEIEKLFDTQKIVILYALPGYGKTALAAAYVKKATNDGIKKCNWFNFRDLGSLRFSSWATKLITTFRSHVRDQGDMQSIVLEVLKKEKCIIVLENIDEISQDLLYEYYKFFNLFASTSQESRLLITSNRDHQLNDGSSDSNIARGYIRSKQIEGLSKEQAIKLMSLKLEKLIDLDEESEYVVELSALTDGNPLLIEAMRGYIESKLSEGDDLPSISELQEGIMRMPTDRRIDPLTMETLFRKNFLALGEKRHQVIFTRLSIFFGSITLEMLKSLYNNQQDESSFGKVMPRDLICLQSYALLSDTSESYGRTRSHYEMLPLVKNFAAQMHNQLLSDGIEICSLDELNCRAADFYLRQCKGFSSTDMGKYKKAFQHFCQANNFEAAFSKVADVCEKNLLRCGDHQTSIEWYEVLTNACIDSLHGSPQLMIGLKSMIRLGIAKFEIGFYTEAEKCLKTANDKITECLNLQNEGNSSLLNELLFETLLWLGNVESAQHNRAENATLIHQKALNFAQDKGIKIGIIKSKLMLGFDQDRRHDELRESARRKKPAIAAELEAAKQQLDMAIVNYKSAIDLIKTLQENINDDLERWISAHYNGLARAHRKLAEYMYEIANDYYEQSFKYSKDVPWEKAMAFCSLGYTHYLRGNHSEANSKLKEASQLMIEMRNDYRKAICLMRIQEVNERIFRTVEEFGGIDAIKKAIEENRETVEEFRKNYGDLDYLTKIIANS